MSPYLNQFSRWRQIGGSCFVQWGLFSHLTGGFNAPCSFWVVICCTGTAERLFFLWCVALLSAQVVPQIYMSVFMWRICFSCQLCVICKLLAGCPRLTVQIRSQNTIHPTYNMLILPESCCIVISFDSNASLCNVCLCVKSSNWIPFSCLACLSLSSLVK